MRVLTVRQPWADLIASGAKSLEIRSWPTSYRGPLLIAAGAAPSRDERARVHPTPEPERLGILVCVVDLVDVRPAVRADARLCGGFDPTGEWAWVLARPRRVQPVKFKGTLGLREVEPRVRRAIGI